MLSTLPVGASVVLDVTPHAVLERLCRSGRTLIGVRSGGAKHERIGLVEAVEPDGSRLHVRGRDHGCIVDQDAVATIAFTLGESKKSGLLPQLDLFDNAGRLLVQIMGMGGGDALMAAMNGLNVKEGIVPVIPDPAPPQGVPATDAGGLAFRCAVACAEQVSIELRLPHVTSFWRGKLDEVRYSERFINVIFPDFHMHLRAGAVSRWISQTEGGATIMEALDPAGQALGMIVKGPVGFETGAEAAE